MGATTPTIWDTIDYVRDLFEGVLDKGGKPYADHCIRVWSMSAPGSSEDEQHAALLHDVIEDAKVTFAEMRQRGYSARTVNLVERLTRPAQGTYLDYIRSIADSGDQGLIRIKLADNLDNSNPARIAALPPAERGIADRYKRARYVLTAALAPTSLTPGEPT